MQVRQIARILVIATPLTVACGAGGADPQDSERSGSAAVAADAGLPPGAPPTPPSGFDRLRATGSG